MSLGLDKISYSQYGSIYSLPSNKLAMEMKSIIKSDQLPYLKPIFGDSIYCYNNDKLEPRNLPALNIYPSALSGKDDNYYFSGTITMDVIFPTSIAQEYQVQVISTAVESVLIQIKNIDFLLLLRDVVPGLVRLGFSYDLNYKDSLITSTDRLTFISSIKIKYDINLEQWKSTLADEGRSWINSNVICFDTIETILPEVEEKSAL